MLNKLEIERTRQPALEVNALRNQLHRLQEIEQHCRQTEAALAESERRYRQLFQSAPIALMERDASRLKIYLQGLRASGIVDINEHLAKNPCEIHYCWSLIKTVDHNPALRKLMGNPADSGFRDALMPTDSKNFLELARDIILAVDEGRNAGEREVAVVTNTGERKFVLGKSLVVSGHEGTLERVVVALVDISKRKKAEEALLKSERRYRNQAIRDDLTGLFNRRYLYPSLDSLLQQAKTEQAPISLIFVDLDHFKQVVDTHGHLNGSRAIQEVGRTIDGCVDAPAFAVAYAGDEFVVVLPGMDNVQALEKASEIRSRVKNSVYVLKPRIEVRLQASFGVASFPEDVGDANGLIAAADRALLSIKTSDKGGIGRFQR